MPVKSYLPDVMWPARLENLPVTAVARIGMAVTRAKPMAAAIRPYSMAVAPDSSLTKRTNLFILNSTSLQHLVQPYGASCAVVSEP